MGTWDYNPQRQCLRLRSPEESQEIVNSAKRKAAEQAAAQAEKKARLEAASIPTKVVLLTNLVGAGDVDEDLEEETADEAKKYGKLEKCTIKEIEGLSDDRAVRIFLCFETVEAATKCFSDMNGRFFAGRKVRAEYYDEALFSQG